MENEVLRLECLKLAIKVLELYRESGGVVLEPSQDAIGISSEFLEYIKAETKNI